MTSNIIDKKSIQKKAKRWKVQNDYIRLINKAKVKELVCAMGLSILESEEFYNKLAHMVFTSIRKSAIRSIDNHRTAVKASDL